MTTQILKIIAAAVIISLVSWLSHKKVQLAGFLTALPLVSMLALAFAQMEWKNGEQGVLYAKSIFAAIPVSLLFFVPFLFAQKWNLSFWQCYIAGVILLALGFYLHRYFLSL